MKRRLRKKKRVADFRETGFSVRFANAPLSPDQQYSLASDWISQGIEANGLSFMGTNDTTTWDGFIALGRRGSATEEHRSAIEKWLSQDKRVTDQHVGPLVDAWHSSKR